MAGNTDGKQAGPAAEGARIGAELGMGRYQAGWAGRCLLPRVKTGVVVLVFAVPPALLLLFLLITNPGELIAHRAMLMAPCVAVAASLALGLLLVRQPRRAWGRVFAYVGGMVQVSSRPPRLVAMRYADMATVDREFAEDTDDTIVSGCVLRDHAGTAMVMRAPLYDFETCRLIAAQAELDLAGWTLGKA
jgi:hypothetical protein